MTDREAVELGGVAVVTLVSAALFAWGFRRWRT